MQRHPNTAVVDAARSQRPGSRWGLLAARRASQLGFLALWLALFVLTRHQVTAALPPDLFLVTDPLAAALALGAAHVAVPAMAASLVLVAVTLLLGRVFCGWVCPLGTLLDGAAVLLRPRRGRLSEARHRAMQRWKYVILAVMVLGALLSAQWIYLLDPLVLLFRAVAAGIYPVATAALPERTAGALGMTYHVIAIAPVLLLLVVVGLTAVTPRFYCRYLCPLGALYGLLARVPLLRRRVRGCDACRSAGGDVQCARDCRMGAVTSNPHVGQSHECIRCFSGRSRCPRAAIQFEWTAPALTRKDAELSLSRRSFLAAGATGAALAPLVSLSAYHRGDRDAVVRPPRVADEELFVDQCVRCAMCVQACPTQTLQLVHLEAGVAGLWTPALTPSVGGCIPDCNACAEVCPTDAIPAFGKEEADKWALKMGTAVLEKSRCISYTDGQLCQKCLNICPTKAFVVERLESGLARPARVDYARCVGCGLCENECAKIVFGAPALVTVAHGRGQPTSLGERPTWGYPCQYTPGSVKPED